MIWPVPASHEKKVPAAGMLGSFWECRGDRYHCGVDIYAPEGSQVLALESGLLVDMGVFTMPEQVDYWNKTYFIVLMHRSDLFVCYAELDASVFENDDFISEGECIGHVRQVLNPEKISGHVPDYIRQLYRHRQLSMLHLEMFSAYPCEIEDYMGGNCYQSNKPEFLLNPADYMKSVETIDAECSAIKHAFDKSEKEF